MSIVSDLLTEEELAEFRLEEANTRARAKYEDYDKKMDAFAQKVASNPELSAQIAQQIQDAADPAELAYKLASDDVSPFDAMGNIKDQDYGVRLVQGLSEGLDDAVPKFVKDESGPDADIDTFRSGLPSESDSWELMQEVSGQDGIDMRVEENAAAQAEMDAVMGQESAALEAHFNPDDA